MDEKLERYWLWLNNIKGIGNKKINKLLNMFESPIEIYSAEEKMLSNVQGISERDISNIVASRKDKKIDIMFEELNRKNISFTYPGKKDYPIQLNEMYDKPTALYYKGKLPDTKAPIVSIIGARACSEYGRTVAMKFAKEFCRIGIQIVSGLALGIDAAGHKGAIDAGGYTLAVMGSGVDICYPRGNIELYTQMIRQGGILSEYPPGTAPIAGNFPMRNRIISALSDVVVVVEARNKSGSLITVDQALEQNKDVMVVPGRIGDPLSEGCNSLIQMGAQMIINAKDILINKKIADFYDEIKAKKSNENSDFIKSGLAREKNMLYSCLNLYPKSMNIIIEETQMDIQQISNALLELELEGLIKEVAKGSYVRVHL